MTCDEFERVLPELEGGHSSEQEEHLKSCSSCAGLVSDLNAIKENARLLPEYEPGPQVWNSIEAALRQEGLIRQPQLQIVAQPQPSRSPRWRFAWLVPIAAAALFGSGLFLIHRQVNRQFATQPATSASLTTAAESNHNVSSADEEQILAAVAARAPAMRAPFESDLRAVEAYIRDAELSARDNPNDQIAQQYLMNAYEQRAMVYEMAINRAMQ